MADIPQFSPGANDAVKAIWFEAFERWARAKYVISGGLAAEQISPNMTLAMDSCLTPYGTASAGNVTISAHHDTLARMDVIYVTTAGAFAVWQGDNLAIVDPLGNYNPSTHANWTQLSSPYPKAGLPDGVPLYVVFVAPAVTVIRTADTSPVAKYQVTAAITWPRPYIMVATTIAAGEVLKCDSAKNFTAGLLVGATGGLVLMEW